MWIATFVKLHRIFKIHNFLIFKWNINLISCQKLKLAFVRECDGQPVSPVLQPTYMYVAPCSGASPVARGTSLQTPICSGHKIWRDRNANYLSRIAAPSSLCLAAHRPFHGVASETGDSSGTEWPTVISAVSSIPACITVTFGSSSFVVFKPFSSRWQKWLLDTRQTIQAPAECDHPVPHETTLFNTIQDCSLSSKMSSIDISYQQEDPANIFCIYVSLFIYCNMGLGMLLKIYIYFFFSNKFPGRKPFFR